MPLVPDTARWACLYNTRGAKARSGGVRVGFKCSLVRGNKRRCARMALGISPPPSVALLLLSGFTTPTLGGWEPPRPRQTACCRNARALQNSCQTVLLHGFYPMTQFLESCYREFRRYGKQASKSKYSLLFNAIACVILLLHSTNWSSKNIKGGYEVAYDSAFQNLPTFLLGQQ